MINFRSCLLGNLLCQNGSKSAETWFLELFVSFRPVRDDTPLFKLSWVRIRNLSVMVGQCVPLPIFAQLCCPTDQGGVSSQEFVKFINIPKGYHMVLVEMIQSLVEQSWVILANNSKETHAIEVLIWKGRLVGKWVSRFWMRCESIWQNVRFIAMDLSCACLMYEC